ncbi:MAG TPA: flagellar hook capping FlgD N-terminal domain-containing protein [Bryobacteraceae bacterium]|nr:flagellar hook capping FlgD N-terminal domain-containing protein [Bryobacteraceae bacterium]
MASAVSAVTSGAAPTPGAASPLDNLANSETFLKLLVAQIQNQNPLDPTDSVQFVTQLAQFSQLEQTIGIRSDVADLRQHADAGASGAANP